MADLHNSIYFLLCINIYESLTRLLIKNLISENNFVE